MVLLQLFKVLLDISAQVLVGRFYYYVYYAVQNISFFLNIMEFFLN